MSDFTKWEKYPFTVDGVDFVSLIKPNGAIHKQVQKISSDVFISMNQGAIRELIGKVSLLSVEDINKELDRLNEGYSEAYISLV